MSTFLVFKMQEAYSYFRAAFDSLEMGASTNRFSEKCRLLLLLVGLADLGSTEVLI